MFTIFGLVAIVLASVGMYGVMSFSVNQRRQEFGVRMALGAHYLRILRMVLTQGAIQLALGLFIGLGLAFGLATLAGSGIQNILFGRHRPRSGHLQRGRIAHHDRLARRDAGSCSSRHPGRPDDRAPRGTKSQTLLNARGPAPAPDHSSRRAGRVSNKIQARRAIRPYSPPHTRSSRVTPPFTRIAESSRPSLVEVDQKSMSILVLILAMCVVSEMRADEPESALVEFATMSWRRRTRSPSVRAANDVWYFLAERLN
jgi:hypothetical protein